MNKIIEVELNNINDLTEKYNKNIVSSNLLNYLIDRVFASKKSEHFNIIIHNNLNREDVVQIIKEGIYVEYQKTLKNYKLTNIKQGLLIIIGLLFLVLSSLVNEESIFKELILIAGWVPIWDAFDIELFSDIKERKKLYALKKLLNANYTIE